MKDEIDIIIPVYDGYEETVRCIESVLLNGLEDGVFLNVINDNSPDNKLTEWLRSASKEHNFSLHENDAHLGFAATVNRGMALHRDRDVVLLHSDTLVAGNWVGRMAAHVENDSTIASVTPFSNNAAICSFPNCLEENELITRSVGLIDRAFSEANAGMSEALPTAIGFCMYINRKCISQIGMFDAETFGRGYADENTFCMRAVSTGWKHVVAADVFVAHVGGIHFSFERRVRVRAAQQVISRSYPEYQSYIAEFAVNNPLRLYRLKAYAELIRISSKKTVLIISHRLGGGVEKHVRELQAHLGKDGFFPIIRAGDSDGICEFAFSPTSEDKIRFSFPGDYKELLSLCRAIGVGKVYVHHTWGIDAKLLTLAKDIGCAMDFMAHDYYLVNANPTLSSEDGWFCENISTRDKQCAERHEIPSGRSAVEWRETQQTFLNNCERILTPSQDTAERLGEYFKNCNPSVVYHPDSLVEPYPEPKLPQRHHTGITKILVLGALSKEKGADIVESTALLASKAKMALQIHLLGYAYRPLQGVIEHGAYSDADVDKKIASIAPDLIWYPASWPETYSYTLSAGLRSARPIIASNFGAFPERLQGRMYSGIDDWKNSAGAWLNCFATFTKTWKNQKDGGKEWRRIYTASSEFYSSFWDGVRAASCTPIEPSVFFRAQPYEKPSTHETKVRNPEKPVGSPRHLFRLFGGTLLFQPRRPSRRSREKRRKRGKSSTDEKSPGRNSASNSSLFRTAKSPALQTQKETPLSLQKASPAAPQNSARMIIERIRAKLRKRRQSRRATKQLRSVPVIIRTIDPRKPNVAFVSHEASRTGAPILALNIIDRLTERYNVFVILLGGGELEPAFFESAAILVGPYAAKASLALKFSRRELGRVLDPIIKRHRLEYAIINTIESRILIKAFSARDVPTVALIHEFSSYTFPSTAFSNLASSSTEVVFPASVVKADAVRTSPLFKRAHILPPGRSVIPGPAGANGSISEESHVSRVLSDLELEPEKALILGCGTVHMRKGVDLFIGAAENFVSPSAVPVKFLWIGSGYTPDASPHYSVYLRDQMVRSGLENVVEIAGPIPDLDEAYQRTAVFFLSSRLDPLPNVAIEALYRGIPVVCFENTTGIAEILQSNPVTACCVVPYLDVHAASDMIAKLVSDTYFRKGVSSVVTALAEKHLDMDRFISEVDRLGQNARKRFDARAFDIQTISQDQAFDAEMFLSPKHRSRRRKKAVSRFVRDWSEGRLRRKPMAGFCIETYECESAWSQGEKTVNPLAHFLRQGKPPGPWLNRVITPGERCNPVPDASPLVLHIHLYYPDIGPEVLDCLNRNKHRCDLLVSTSSDANASELESLLRSYDRGNVKIKVVPNRGRDIAPMLCDFAPELMRYDICGHIHGKKTMRPAGEMGTEWRHFLFENLVGGCAPMLDIIAAEMAADPNLGLVFPNEPRIIGWDSNLEEAQNLSSRMGMGTDLPEHINFPAGTMFWARPTALKPLFELNLEYADFPEEPLPPDGTMLHAIERLLPLIAEAQGYQSAVTHVPGVSR